MIEHTRSVQSEYPPPTPHNNLLKIASTSIVCV